MIENSLPMVNARVNAGLQVGNSERANKGTKLAPNAKIVVGSK